MTEVYINPLLKHRSHPGHLHQKQLVLCEAYEMYARNRLLSSLVLLLGAAIGLAQNDLEFVCSTSSDEHDCSDFISDFCTTISSIPFEPLQMIERCSPISPTVHCDVIAWRGAANSSSPAEPFNLSNCESVLPFISAECPSGGSGILSGDTFVFTISTNPGTCGSSGFIPNPPIRPN